MKSNEIKRNIGIINRLFCCQNGLKTFYFHVTVYSVTNERAEPLRISAYMQREDGLPWYYI